MLSSNGNPVKASKQHGSRPKESKFKKPQTLARKDPALDYEWMVRKRAEAAKRGVVYNPARPGAAALEDAGSTDEMAMNVEGGYAAGERVGRKRVFSHAADMPGDGTTELPQSRRPDGSLRPAVRVRKGYVPPEEQIDDLRRSLNDTTPAGTVFGAETVDPGAATGKSRSEKRAARAEKHQKKKPEGGDANAEAEDEAAPVTVEAAPAAESIDQGMRPVVQEDGPLPELDASEEYEMHELHEMIKDRDDTSRALMLELRASEDSRLAAEAAWSRTEAELARWQRGELRHVPEVTNVETGQVSSIVVVDTDAERRGLKRACEPTALAHLIEASQKTVRIKQEVVEHKAAAADAEERLEDQLTCVVCMAQPRSAVLRPCNHYVCCSQCALQQTHCPSAGCGMLVASRLQGICMAPHQQTFEMGTGPPE